MQVLQIGEQGLTADIVDDDKCRVLANSVLDAWRGFCTPRNGVLDEALFAHIKQCLTAWASDRCPAVMKAARFLRRDCPNLEFIYKDPCHTVRAVASLIDTSFPHAESVFFQDKTSVVPTIQNSHEWRAKLIWVEKLVLAHPQLAPALKVALRHFSWVRPRWESSAGPRRRLCHLIVPTALLLAVSAADARTAPAEKQRRGFLYCMVLLNTVAGLLASFLWI